MSRPADWAAADDWKAHKERGNNHFKKKDYDDAVEAYTDAVNSLNQSQDFIEAELHSPDCPQDTLPQLHEMLEQNRQNKAVVFANRAMAYIKLQNFRLAEMDCSVALACNKQHEKARSRRGFCRERLKLYNEALEDYVVLAESTNPQFKKDAITHIAWIQKRRAARALDPTNPKLQRQANGRPLYSRGNNAPRMSQMQDQGLQSDDLTTRVLSGGAHHYDDEFFTNPQDENIPDVGSLIQKYKLVQDLRISCELAASVGEIWAVVDSQWWEKWVEATKAAAAADAKGAAAQDDAGKELPTFSQSVDNTRLLDGSEHKSNDQHTTLNIGHLVTDTPPMSSDVTEKDYVLVPVDAWKLVQSWYGGGPLLCRPLSSVEPLRAQLHVTTWHVTKSDNSTTAHGASVPSQFDVEVYGTNTVRHMVDEICSKFVLAASDLRFLALHQDVAHVLPNDATFTTIQDLVGPSVRELKMEVRHPNGLWPSTAPPLKVGIGLEPATSPPTPKSSQRTEVQSPVSEAASSVLSAAPSSAALFFHPSGCPCCGRVPPRMLKCSRCKAAKYCSARCQRSHWPFHKGVCGTQKQLAGRVQRQGLVGLKNIGNTCFMNAPFQCLSHTAELTSHFLSGRFKSELNTDNPLGKGGEVAKNYAKAVKHLWFGTKQVYVPAAFHTRLQEWAPQFVKGQQHDAQEFVMFLLDMLHEDLNRVKVKPYVETKDSDGRPDEVVAEEQWKDFLKRNQSLVVDHLHGQLKDTLVCPKCDMVCVRFEPFSMLSLPIPDSRLHLVSVTLRRANGQRAVRYFVPVSERATIAQVKDVLSSMALERDRAEIARVRRLSSTVDEKQNHSDDEAKALPVASLMVADVAESRFYKPLGDGRAVKDIPKSTSLIVYEVKEQHRDARLEKGLRQVRFLFREASDAKEALTKPRLFATPLAYDFPEKSTGAALYAWLWSQVQRFVQRRPDGSLPYVLKWTKRKGTVCSQCSNNTCRGCVLSDSSDPVSLSDRATFAVEFDAADREKYFSANEEALLDVESRQKEKEEEVLKSMDINACLKQFTTAEVLEDGDSWYCSRCKEHVRASKKLELWRLPGVLIVHLKRFKTQRSMFGAVGGRKVNTLIDFPLDNLDLSGYISSQQTAPPNYELYGIVRHTGRMGFGHYTAYVKAHDYEQYDHTVKRRNSQAVREPSGPQSPSSASSAAADDEPQVPVRWFHVNDSKFEAVDESKISKGEAYMLFYRRKV